MSTKRRRMLAVRVNPLHCATSRELHFLLPKRNLAGGPKAHSPPLRDRFEQDPFAAANYFNLPRRPTPNTPPKGLGWYTRSCTTSKVSARSSRLTPSISSAAVPQPGGACHSIVGNSANATVALESTPIAAKANRAIRLAEARYGLRF